MSVFIFIVQDELMGGLRCCGDLSRLSHPLAIPVVAIDGALEVVRLTVRSIEHVASAIFNILGAVVGGENYSLKEAIKHVQYLGCTPAGFAVLPVKLLYNVITIMWNPAQNAYSVALF